MQTWERYNETARKVEETAELELEQYPDRIGSGAEILEALLPIGDDTDDHGYWSETEFRYRRGNDWICIRRHEEENR